MIGAAIIVDELGKGTVTNPYGFFSINLKPGFYHLSFSYVGYEDQSRAINLNDDLVMTIELNYSDDPASPMITEENRRYSQLALVLRAHTLMDIDCWSVVPGHPLSPNRIGKIIDARLGKMEGAE